MINRLKNEKINIVRVYYAFTISIACIFSGAGHIQARDTFETSLETITVTANKQEENIQEVPISITAVGELEINDRNISSVEELADFVPNLMIQGQGVSNSKVPVMRGIMAELGTLSVSTGMFIDGVPVLAFSGYEDTLQNIERVEVLRGPQGTLYGKNTEVGAINIITTQPDNHFRGKVSADGGEDHKKEISFNLNGPIVRDTLFFGLAGQYYEKEGFITHGISGDPVNDKQHWYGKGQLRWTPTDVLDIQLIISQLEYDNNGSDLGLSEDGAGAFGLPASGDRQVFSDLNAKEASKTSAQSLKASYDMGETLTLTSITTHRIVKDDYTLDYDFNPVEFLHNRGDSEYERISQELRLTSNNDRMRGVAGVYYDKSDDVAKYAISSIIPVMNTESHREIDGESYAVFGQLRWALTSKMGITGGLRYEYQEKEMNNITAGLSYDDTWDDIAPKFSLDYSFTPQIMGYATVAKGFSSGGFNPISTAPQYTSYEQEELWSYEIGTKTQLFDNRLLVNAALFYMDIDNMQVTEYVSAYESYITNAATATSYGAELEIQARITSQFMLTGSFGYTKAEFDEFQDALGDYKDNKAPFSPEYTFSLGGQYRARNGFYAGADWVGYGKMYIDSANNYSRDAYVLINAKAGYEAENWDIYLYAKNLLDEDYTVDGFGGGFYKLYSEPREMGMKLNYRF